MQAPLPDDYKSLIKRCGYQDFWLPGLPPRISCPDVFATRKKAENWLLENLPALTRAGIKQRRCLCCQTLFLSLGAHNRMCQRCRCATEDQQTASISRPRGRFANA